jgi:hypothetical protein
VHDRLDKILNDCLCFMYAHPAQGGGTKGSKGSKGLSYSYNGGKVRLTILGYVFASRLCDLLTHLEHGCSVSCRVKAKEEARAVKDHHITTMEARCDRRYGGMCLRRAYAIY